MQDDRFFLLLMKFSGTLPKNRPEGAVFIFSPVGA